MAIIGMVELVVELLLYIILEVLVVELLVLEPTFPDQHSRDIPDQLVEQVDLDHLQLQVLEVLDLLFLLLLRH